MIKEKRNFALSWWLIQVYTMMHGQKSIKLHNLDVDLSWESVV